MATSVLNLGLRGLTREVSRAPAPAPFETDVPVFFGAVAGPTTDEDPFTPVTSVAEFEATFKAREPSHLPQALVAFFRNGGRRAFIAPWSPADPASTLAARLEALRDRLDIDLVCAPDFSERPDELRQLLDHLALGPPQFAVLDVPLDVATSLRRRDDPSADACALYGPWVRVADGERVAFVPPSGFVAGTFARVGPGAAPANLVLDGALDVRALRPPDAPIPNPLTARPGRGVRVEGAQTLGGRDIAARRLLQTIERWCRLNLDAVAFEPATFALCARVRRGVEAFLLHLHRAGLLSGATPADAFLVVCDERNNPRAGLADGRLVVDLHVVPSRTVQQVHVQLVRVDGRVTVAVDSP